MRTKLVAIVFGLLLMGCEWEPKAVDKPILQSNDNNKVVTVIEIGGNWYRTVITATPVPGGTLYVAKDVHGLSITFVPTPK
jgi:hypothetical protein